MSTGRRTTRARRVAALVLAALAALAAAPPAAAGVRGALADPQVALRVGDWSLSAPALDFLQRVAALQDAQVTRVAVTASALEDRVLGEHARAAVGDGPLFDDERVAQTPQAAAEATLYASLAAAWRQPIAAALGGDGGARFVTRRHPLTHDRLRALLGAGPDAGVRLDDRLDAAHAAALRDVTLVDWRIDAATAGRITLHDVWTRLTLQQRLVLTGGDADFAFHQAADLVRQAFVRRWATLNTGLADADFDRLQDLMADHDRRIALTRWLGVADDAHRRGSEIEKLRLEVSQADIERYYAAHPDEFKRTERVRARHVRCNDEAAADAASAALRRGDAFDAVARRFSVASDRTSGGDLGWIDIEQARGEWLGQLAFAQPPGAPTAPVREPSASETEGGWQIIQVLERTLGRHPVDSETVRFAASGAIARERAVSGYAALRTRLLADADIDLNVPVLGFAPAALVDRGFP